MDYRTYQEMYHKVPYFESCDEMRSILAGVLASLPEEVRDFVIRRCIFLFSPESAGITYTVQFPVEASREYHFILMSDWLWWECKRALLRKRSRKAYLLARLEQRKGWRYFTAHEIAHAYLNHMGSHTQDPEGDADKLAAEWGFPLSE
ncbi:hypothetical protein ES703_38943 [subsurface metagenome]